MKATRKTPNGNLSNKILGFSFPFSVGTGAALELIPLTSITVGLTVAIASSVFLSGFFELAGVFARDYEKQ